MALGAYQRTFLGDYEPQRLRTARKIYKSNNKTHLRFFDAYGRIPAKRCSGHNAKVVFEVYGRNFCISNVGKSVGRYLKNNTNYNNL